MGMRFQTPEQVEKRRRALLGGEVSVGPAVTELADWALARWAEAVQHRDESGFTERMAASRRQANSEYDPDVLAKIEKQGGSKANFGLTETKALAANSWMRDILTPDGGDKPWSTRIRTTPEPELPADAQQMIIQTALDRFAGQQPESSEVIEFVEELWPQIERMIDEEARERADRTEQVMTDQLEEGGFTEALVGFLDNLTVYPLAWLKGPCVEPKLKPVWNGQTMEVEERLVPAWYPPDPEDMYPAPNARHFEDGPLCERVRMQRSELRRMRGVDGWRSDAIDEVLESGESADVVALRGEQERAHAEGRDLTKEKGLTKEQLEGVQMHAMVEADLLRSWGMTLEGDDDVSVRLLLFGKTVVYAGENPDKLRRYPYACTSMYPAANGLAGKSLAEKIRGPAFRANAAVRALDNNLAFIARPMPTVDLDALKTGTTVDKVFPGMIFQYRSSQVAGRGHKPIEFYVPPSHTREFLDAIEFASEDADKRCLIPEYVHGDEHVRGPGETASGFQMLLSAAAKGIRLVILRVGTDVMTRMLDMLHMWDMQYLGDESLYGDVVVVSRGLLATIEKYQTQMRRQDFLKLVSNPIDQQIVQVLQRAVVLRALASDLDLPAGKVVPPEDELRSRLESQPMQQQQQPPMGGEEAVA